MVPSWGVDYEWFTKVQQSLALSQTCAEEMDSADPGFIPILTP